MSDSNLEQLTFSNLKSQFLLDRTTIGRSPRTISSYSDELGLFERWMIKNNHPTNFDSLSSDLLRRYFSELSTHRNKGGVHSSYRIIKAWMNWVCYEYEIPKNPIQKIKIQANNIPPMPEIPLTDIQKLLAACNSKYKYRDIAVLKMLVDTGARANELLGMNFGDIDLVSGQVNIRLGKGGKSRVVWIGEKAKKAIKEYLDTREGIINGSPLFVNEDGKRLKFYGLRQLVLRLCHRAVIKEYGLHCFRRTFALTLYRKGVDIITISRLLGHSKIEVTKRYLNVSNEDLRDAIAKASPADSLD